jgi:hypothetical protein
MTGAGLLGLAVGLGVAAEPSRPAAADATARDPAVDKGLRALGRAFGLPRGRQRQRDDLTPGVNLYFLWTLERVAVLYNLREIDGRDWYRWGAEILVDSQSADGSWQLGGYPGSLPAVDTCFALLFLHRANLVPDLSKRLQFVVDPATLDGRR